MREFGMPMTMTGVPFAGTVGIVMLTFNGLAYNLFPWLLVDQLTIWQAVSSNESLWIIFVGTCVVLPVIVGYTVFSYPVFQGKATVLEYWGDLRLRGP